MSPVSQILNHYVIQQFYSGYIVQIVSVQSKIYTCMFRAALFTIAKANNNPSVLWMNKQNVVYACKGMIQPLKGMKYWEFRGGHWLRFRAFTAMA